MEKIRTAEEDIKKGRAVKRNRTGNMIMCGLFTALIAAGAFIRIPVPSHCNFCSPRLQVL